MRKALLALALGLPLVSLPALAATPGFDCLEAKTPAEMLVCADGGLASRDTALTEAYKAKRATAAPEQAKALQAEQRAWLKARDTACPLPKAASPADIPLAQLWQAAPCLARVYDARLAALGAEVPPTAAPPHPLHPLCVAAALPGFGDGSSAPLPLKACAQGNVQNPVFEESDVVSSEGTPWGPTWAWFSYLPLGRLADGRDLILAQYDGGGTGSFSSVAALRQTPGAQGEVMLQAEILRGGGDRCNGGIDTATREGDSVRLELALTPLSLLSLMGVRAAQDDNAAALELPDCAACCAATATVRHPLNGGGETLISVEIGEDAASFITLPGATQAERCYLKVIAQPGAKTFQTLDPGQALATAAAFDACLGK
ncbi:lysozyme inhibitor LprI family protein [Pararhodospirillum photometricum]|nr:lysozyme inhibitor LprI family protein [Pararhodospirillum photometricum]